MIRVGIVAAFASVRAGLEALLTGLPDVQVAARGADLPDLQPLLADDRLDVILIDAPSGRSDFLDRLYHTGVPLVLLGDLPEEGITLLSGNLPGWGWLPRDAGAEEITAAVRAAAAGLVTLPTERLSWLHPAPAGPAAPDRSDGEALTVREREVLQLMAQGLPNKQIASRLAISTHTVKFHAASLMAKLGASSRTEAVTLGVRRGDVLL